MPIHGIWNRSVVSDHILRALPKSATTALTSSSEFEIRVTRYSVVDMIRQFGGALVSAAAPPGTDESKRSYTRNVASCTARSENRWAT